MSLENWMETRKIILLKEKKEKLFQTLPRTPDFHAARAELYKLLSRIEHEERGILNETPFKHGVPMVA